MFTWHLNVVQIWKKKLNLILLLLLFTHAMNLLFSILKISNNYINSIIIIHKLHYVFIVILYFYYNFYEQEKSHWIWYSQCWNLSNATIIIIVYYIKWYYENDIDDRVLKTSTVPSLSLVIILSCDIKVKYCIGLLYDIVTPDHMGHIYVMWTTSH